MGESGRSVSHGSRPRRQEPTMQNILRYNMIR
jgi:hypothetical protein